MYNLGDFVCVCLSVCLSWTGTLRVELPTGMESNNRSQRFKALSSFYRYASKLLCNLGKSHCQTIKIEVIFKDVTITELPWTIMIMCWGPLCVVSEIVAVCKQGLERDL